jgi:MFS family permease
LLVPTVSLLIAGRLIQRFGPAPVVAAGLLCFAAGGVWWAMAASLEPHYATVIGGMALIGAGTGLALPTMMGTATGALPASSFATGSGVINMIRQTGMAVGVAAFVAIIGTPGSPVERLVAFRHAWWAMAAIVALGLIPALLLRRPSARAAIASPLAANPQPS